MASLCAPGCAPAAFHAPSSTASLSLRKCSSRLVCSRRSRMSAGLLTPAPLEEPPIGRDMGVPGLPPMPAPWSRPRRTACGERSTGGRPGGFCRKSEPLPDLPVCKVRTCLSCAPTPFSSRSRCERSCTSSSNWCIVTFCSSSSPRSASSTCCAFARRSAPSESARRSWASLSLCASSCLTRLACSSRCCSSCAACLVSRSLTCLSAAKSFW
mmetsp:Transcript_60406/g.145232  ORF Transcript_60406/g.145232 Transcript_60406/m.145232 type:complete len:212 (+) Transcript_60406:314-949(+)